MTMPINLMMNHNPIQMEYRVNYDNDVMVQNVMTSYIWRHPSFCSRRFLILKTTIDIPTISIMEREKEKERERESKKK